MTQAPERTHVYVDPVDCNSFAEYIWKHKTEIQKIFGVPEYMLKPKSSIGVFINTPEVIDTPYGNLYNRKLRIRR